jgi:hypothetical protein
MYNEKNRYALHIFVIKKTRKYLCKIKISGKENG